MTLGLCPPPPPQSSLSEVSPVLPLCDSSTDWQMTAPFLSCHGMMAIKLFVS